jgi:hypothetical protein
MTTPFLEAFLMAEDIRMEQSGQCTLVGVFSDKVFSKAWPMQLPKMWFHVRVRDVGGTPAHSLRLTEGDAKGRLLVELSGESPVPADGVYIFNYVFSPSPPLENPGLYTARITLRAKEETIFTSDYAFRVLNPEPKELYAKCSSCDAKYAASIIAEDTSQLSNVTVQTKCPRCGADNRLAPGDLFFLPNPKE